MTTSGVNTFNPVRDEITKSALRLVGAYNSTDEPRPEQLNDANLALNLLLKSWQVQGFLWLKKFALLTLVPGQATYQLGAWATDTCVYDGTATQITRPTRISYAAYRNSTGVDREMTPLARNDYMKLSNKAAAAPSTQYFYDPQTEKGQLILWPVPIAADHIFFSCDRGIFDMLGSDNTYDVPQEWLRVIKYALAVEIAPEYAMPSGEFQLLNAKYEALRADVESYNHEVTPFQAEIA